MSNTDSHAEMDRLMTVIIQDPTRRRPFPRNDPGSRLIISWDGEDEESIEYEFERGPLSRFPTVEERGRRQREEAEAQRLAQDTVDGLERFRVFDEYDRQHEEAQDELHQLAGKTHTVESGFWDACKRFADEGPNDDTLQKSFDLFFDHVRRAQQVTPEPIRYFAILSWAPAPDYMRTAIHKAQVHYEKMADVRYRAHELCERSMGTPEQDIEARFHAHRDERVPRIDGVFGFGPEELANGFTHYDRPCDTMEHLQHLRASFEVRTIRVRYADSLDRYGFIFDGESPKDWHDSLDGRISRFVGDGIAAMRPHLCATRVTDERRYAEKLTAEMDAYVSGLQRRKAAIEKAEARLDSFKEAYDAGEPLDKALALEIRSQGKVWRDAMKDGVETELVDVRDRHKTILDAAYTTLRHLQLAAQVPRTPQPCYTLASVPMNMQSLPYGFPSPPDPTSSANTHNTAGNDTPATRFPPGSSWGDLLMPPDPSTASAQDLGGGGDGEGGLLDMFDEDEDADEGESLNGGDSGEGEA